MATDKNSEEFKAVTRLAYRLGVTVRRFENLDMVEREVLARQAFSSLLRRTLDYELWEAVTLSYSQGYNKRTHQRWRNV